MYEKIKLFQETNEDKINFYLNHLAVIYMFFIPSIPHSRPVTTIFTLMYILILLRGNYLKYLKISLSHPLTKPFLLFMILQIIWIYGASSLDTLLWWKKYAFYSFYPFFFFLFIDQRFYTRLIGSFILGVMLTELLSYLMQFHIIPWGYYMDIQLPWKDLGKLKHVVFYDAIKGEPTPFFDHSYYSVLLALTAFIVLSKAIYSKSLYATLISFVFFTTLSINLFFIGGRTGYLLYFILLLSMIFYLLKNNHSKVLLSFVLVIPLLLATFMYQSNGILKQRVLQTITIIKSSSLENPSDPRMKLAKVGLDTAMDNPIFGHGTGHDALISMQENPNNKNSEIQKLIDVHNQYIDILLQFGLIGLLIYINLLYKIIKFKPVDKEKNITKTLTIIGMIYTGFLGAFSIFFPTLFVMLIIVSSANQNILNKKVSKIDTKTITYYLLFIIFIYIYGQLQ